MKDLSPGQFMRIEACKIVLELIKAGKKEFETMDKYKSDVNELVEFMRG